MNLLHLKVHLRFLKQSYMINLYSSYQIRRISPWLLRTAGCHGKSISLSAKLSLVIVSLMPSLRASTADKTEEMIAKQQQQQKQQRNGSKNKTKQRPDLGQCKGRHTHIQSREEWREREGETIISQRQPIAARVFCTNNHEEREREWLREWVHKRQWSCLRRCLFQSCALSLSVRSHSVGKRAEQAVRVPALLSTSCSRLNKQTDGVAASVSIGTVRVAHAPSLNRYWDRLSRLLNC